MIIHTLGPQATDSNQAAKFYAQKNPGVIIKLHDSFQDIFDHLTDYQGEYILLPMAYKDAAGNSLGDYHYRLIDKIKLIDSFVTDLDPLVVLENSRRSNKFYIHPATRKLAEKFKGDHQIVSMPSKFLAYQAYQKDGKLTITNQRNIKSLNKDEKIIKKLSSKMSWCLYKVERGN